MNHENFKPRQRRRYEFIEFQLMWEGTVGRKSLQQKFEISPQQSTLDLTSYLDIAPNNMIYDPRQKTYVAGPDFKPLFLKGEASEYLHQLEMLFHGYREADEIWPANIPSYDAVSVKYRKTSPLALKTVLTAIRNRMCIEVLYVSLSSESKKTRRLFPHAIATDGHRWHMRAYDCEKEDFSDFVLSRIEKINLGEYSDTEIPEDTKWSSFIQLQLQPDPELNPRQKERLQIEYNMQDGILSIDMRQAMIFYYLRFYGFNPYETENGTIRNKSSFSLNIVNIQEVEACIGRRR